jgi:hypothetical protein
MYPISPPMTKESQIALCNTILQSCTLRKSYNARDYYDGTTKIHVGQNTYRTGGFGVAPGTNTTYTPFYGPLMICELNLLIAMKWGEHKLDIYDAVNIVDTESFSCANELSSLITLKIDYSGCDVDNGDYVDPSPFMVYPAFNPIEKFQFKSAVFLYLHAPQSASLPFPFPKDGVFIKRNPSIWC